MEEVEPLLTTEELAAYLNVAPKTIRQWRWRETSGGPSAPPAIVRGRLVRYRRSEVDEWLAGLSNSA